MKNIFKYITACVALSFCSHVFAQQVSNPVQNVPVTLNPITYPQVPYPELQDINDGTVLYNYVQTQIPDQPVQVWPNFTEFPYRQTTDYVDGIGRPLQSVAKKAYEDGNDIVQHHVYDAGGNEAYKYLPFVRPAENSYGLFVTTPYTRTRQFFDQAGNDEQPYSQTVTDNSSLNRITRQLAPGRSWVGSNLASEFTYETNADGTYSTGGVIPTYYTTTGCFPRYTIGNNNTDMPVYAGNYDAGQLYITSTKDEDGKITEEIKDKLGRLIYKRAINRKSAAYPLAAPVDMFADNFAYTIYVYNDLGQLRAVLPPEACKPVVSMSSTSNQSYNTITYNYSWSLSPDQFKGLCYSYFYDERGHIVEKTIPGKDVEYYVYDLRDRLVFYQDATLRNQDIWQATIYDALNRPTFTALTQSNGASRQYVLNALATYFPGSTSDVWYYVQHYDLYHPYPDFLYGCKIVSYNYYDDYSKTQTIPVLNFDPNQFTGQYPATTDPTVVSSVKSNVTHGLLTGTKVLVLDPDAPNAGQFLSSAIYYNDKGRVIQTTSQNHLGGTDISSNIYFFQGQLFRNILHQENPGAVAIPNTNDGIYTSYDLINTYYRNFKPGGGNDLVYKHTQRINKPNQIGTEYQLATYSHDQLGRETFKQLQVGNVRRDYDMHGSLNHIQYGQFIPNTDPNAPLVYTNDSLNFDEKLYYDKGFASKLYNGNIAGITWSGADHKLKSYGYSYDNLDRLTHAQFEEFNPTSNVWTNTIDDYTASNMTYDLNGNLQSMNQMVTGTSGPMLMDALTYHYQPNSNQLAYVSDPVSPASTAAFPDFKDLNIGTNDYTFDTNGNLIQDNNKNVSAIAYNYLNKPEKITTTLGNITYVYDVNGNCLQKRIHTNATGADEKWDYLGSFVYKNKELQYILNEEGRARPTFAVDPANTGNSNTKFVYDYFIKDHLGNVRSTVTATPAAYQYYAKHEIASANVEQLFFDNIPNVRDNKPGSNDPNDGMAARLNGGDDLHRVGTAIMLQTMPGDVFNVKVDAFYDGDYAQGDEASGDAVVKSLASALMNGTDYSGVPVGDLPQNVRVVNDILNNPALGDQLNNLLNVNNNINAPKAHLNYLFFDNNMQLLPNSGSVQVTTTNLNTWGSIFPNTPTNPNVVSTGQVVASNQGYVLIYIDNQSIGKDVWFDNLSIGQYTSHVLEESHYYPYGLTLQLDQAPSVTTPQPKKYQGIELEKHFGLETYETYYRGLDPQLGRFNQVDPKIENHYDITPYVSMGNDPALNVDPLGDDWFVNNSDGQVIYLKNVSDINGMAFINAGISIPANQFERLGPNNMFGNTVIDSKGKNMLKRDVFQVDNSEAFMNGRGYEKAENVEIEEKEYTSSGSMGSGERVTQTPATLEQISDSKITYSKPDGLNKKVVEQEKTTKGQWNSTKLITYNLTKPFGQSNNKTAEFSGNKEIGGIKTSNLKAGGSVAGKIFSIIKKYLD